MHIELIPVIDIAYNNQDVAAPNKYPYWENAELWDAYHAECYAKAGFTDMLIPYLKGASFVKLTDISDNNLQKLVIDHTEGLREGEYKREQTCTFFGGYVLKVDGKDAYFPQCCGELSDIMYWEKLSEGQYCYYNGHPEPQIKIDKQLITLDFSLDENDEVFEPPPTDLTLKINREALIDAVRNVKTELDIFAKRLDNINEVNHLNIENISNLLIWHNPNASIKAKSMEILRGS